MSNWTTHNARKAALRLDNELVQRSDDFEVAWSTGPFGASQMETSLTDHAAQPNELRALDKTRIVSMADQGEARIPNHAANEALPSNGKFSKVDWPTPEFIRSAHRARGRLLREIAKAVSRSVRLAFVGGPPSVSRTRRNDFGRHDPVQH
jgi:hypothetical protein